MTVDSGEISTDAMYYCLKCDRHHRRSSSIGDWHQGIEVPKMKRPFGDERPTAEEGAALIAFDMERRESEGKYENVPVEVIQDRWEREGFNEQFPNVDPVEELRSVEDEYGAVGFDRWGGKTRITLLSRSAVRIRQFGSEYRSRGMSWGVRK